MSILEEVKVCTRCARDHPLSSFKRRSKAQGQRLSWCRDCVNESARQLTARKRTAIVGTAAKYVRHNTPASRVEAIVAAACRKAGGIEQFANCIKDAFDSPSMNVRFAAAMFLLKLLTAQDRLRRTATKSSDPLATLSDDERNESVRQHLVEVLVNEPDSMADALRVLGWQVERPSSES